MLKWKSKPSLLVSSELPKGESVSKDTTNRCTTFQEEMAARPEDQQFILGSPWGDSCEDHGDCPTKMASYNFSLDNFDTISTAQPMMTTDTKDRTLNYLESDLNWSPLARKMKNSEKTHRSSSSRSLPSSPVGGKKKHKQETTSSRGGIFSRFKRMFSKHSARDIGNNSLPGSPKTAQGKTESNSEKQLQVRHRSGDKVPTRLERLIESRRDHRQRNFNKPRNVSPLCRSLNSSPTSTHKESRVTSTTSLVPLKEYMKHRGEEFDTVDVDDLDFERRFPVTWTSSSKRQQTKGVGRNITSFHHTNDAEGKGLKSSSAPHSKRKVHIPDINDEGRKDKCVHTFELKNQNYKTQTVAKNTSPGVTLHLDDHPHYTRSDNSQGILDMAMMQSHKSGGQKLKGNDNMKRSRQFLQIDSAALLEARQAMKPVKVKDQQEYCFSRKTSTSKDHITVSSHDSDGYKLAPKHTKNNNNGRHTYKEQFYHQVDRHQGIGIDTNKTCPLDKSVKDVLSITSVSSLNDQQQREDDDPSTKQTTVKDIVRSLEQKLLVKCDSSPVLHTQSAMSQVSPTPLTSELKDMTIDQVEQQVISDDATNLNQPPPFELVQTYTTNQILDLTSLIKEEEETTTSSDIENLENIPFLSETTIKSTSPENLDYEFCDNDCTQSFGKTYEFEVNVCSATKTTLTMDSDDADQDKSCASDAPNNLPSSFSEIALKAKEFCGQSSASLTSSFNILLTDDGCFLPAEDKNPDVLSLQCFNGVQNTDGMKTKNKSMPKIAKHATNITHAISKPDESHKIGNFTAKHRITCHTLQDANEEEYRHDLSNDGLTKDGSNSIFQSAQHNICHNETQPLISEMENTPYDYSLLKELDQGNDTKQDEVNIGSESDSWNKCIICNSDMNVSDDKETESYRISKDITFELLSDLNELPNSYEMLDNATANDLADETGGKRIVFTMPDVALEDKQPINSFISHATFHTPKKVSFELDGVSSQESGDVSVPECSQPGESNACTKSNTETESLSCPLLSSHPSDASFIDNRTFLSQSTSFDKHIDLSWQRGENDGLILYDQRDPDKQFIRPKIKNTNYHFGTYTTDQGMSKANTDVLISNIIESETQRTVGRTLNLPSLESERTTSSDYFDSLEVSNKKDGCSIECTTMRDEIRVEPNSVEQDVDSLSLKTSNVKNENKINDQKSSYEHMLTTENIQLNEPSIASIQLIFEDQNDDWIDNASSGAPSTSDSGGETEDELADDSGDAIQTGQTLNPIKQSNKLGDLTKTKESKYVKESTYYPKQNNYASSDHNSLTSRNLSISVDTDVSKRKKNLHRALCVSGMHRNAASLVLSNISVDSCGDGYDSMEEIHNSVSEEIAHSVPVVIPESSSEGQSGTYRSNFNCHFSSKTKEPQSSPHKCSRTTRPTGKCKGSGRVGNAQWRRNVRRSRSDHSAANSQIPHFSRRASKSTDYRESTKRGRLAQDCGTSHQSPTMAKAAAETQEVSWANVFRHRPGQWIFLATFLFLQLILHCIFA